MGEVFYLKNNHEKCPRSIKVHNYHHDPEILLRLKEKLPVLLCVQGLSWFCWTECPAVKKEQIRQVYASTGCLSIQLLLLTLWAQWGTFPHSRLCVLPGKLYNGFTKANISDLLVLLNLAWMIKQDLLLFLGRSPCLLATQSKINTQIRWRRDTHLSFSGSKRRIVNEKIEKTWCVLFLLHSWGHLGTKADTKTIIPSKYAQFLMHQR